MLVRDLIALLSDMDPDAGVAVTFDGGLGGGYLTEDCVFFDHGTNSVSFDADCAE